jgi:hypothetical protein
MVVARVCEINADSCCRCTFGVSCCCSDFCCLLITCFLAADFTFVAYAPSSSTFLFDPFSSICLIIFVYLSLPAHLSSMHFRRRLFVAVRFWCGARFSLALFPSLPSATLAPPPTPPANFALPHHHHHHHHLLLVFHRHHFLPG